MGVSALLDHWTSKTFDGKSRIWLFLKACVTLVTRIHCAAEDEKRCKRVRRRDGGRSAVPFCWALLLIRARRSPSDGPCSFRSEEGTCRIIVPEEGRDLSARGKWERRCIYRVETTKGMFLRFSHVGRTDLAFRAILDAHAGCTSRYLSHTRVNFSFSQRPRLLVCGFLRKRRH